MQTKHFSKEADKIIREIVKFFQASLKLLKSFILLRYLFHLLIYVLNVFFSMQFFLLLCLSTKKKPCNLLTVYFLLIIILFLVTPNHLILSLPK